MDSSSRRWPSAPESPWIFAGKAAVLVSAALHADMEIIEHGGQGTRLLALSVETQSDEVRLSWDRGRFYELNPRALFNLVAQRLSQGFTR